MFVRVSCASMRTAPAWSDTVRSQARGHDFRFSGLDNETADLPVPMAQHSGCFRAVAGVIIDSPYSVKFEVPPESCTVSFPAT